MHLELTNEQMEQALQFLTNWEPEPPEGLRHLQMHHWMLLQDFLENVMKEKQNSLVH